jgi:hypothetical protein
MSQSRKPIFKKWWFWCIALIVVAGLINSKEDKPEVQQPSPKVTTNELTNQSPTPLPTTSSTPLPSKQPGTTETPKTVLEQITKSGGLGDSRTVIEKNYGKDQNKKPSETFGGYQNSYISVVYAEAMASDITLQYESTSKKRRSVKDALQDSIALIPTDAVKVKEYKADETHDVIEYESNILAERFNDYYDFGKELGDKDKPGTFHIRTNSDKDGIFSLSVSLGSFK